MKTRIVTFNLFLISFIFLLSLNLFGSVNKEIKEIRSVYKRCVNVKNDPNSKKIVLTQKYKNGVLSNWSLFDKLDPNYNMSKSVIFKKKQ